MAKPRSPVHRWMTRTFGHRLEAAVAYAFFSLFRALPLDRASALGGWIGRTAGPWLPGSRTARRNLAAAFPAMDHAARETVVRAMWDNLGRTFAEYPHLAEIAAARVEIVGIERFQALRDDGIGCVFVSGHLANWEVLAGASRALGIELAVVFRAPNNPIVGRLLSRLRGVATSIQIPKGPDGARRLIRVLAEGGHAGLLIDQKMNDGIPVPFFGRDAMTAPAAAQLALRFGLPLVPVRTERLGGARFRVTVAAPLETPSTGSRADDARAVMARLNSLLEAWIRERPAEWLWVHRRWPEERL